LDAIARTTRKGEVQMKKCVYCDARATDMDALGLDACSKHIYEADGYFEEVTGRNPNDDTFEYCDEHGDMWEPVCSRCEECSQHHYGMSVSEFLRSPMSQIHIFTF
jgi:hypothetical protein